MNKSLIILLTLLLCTLACNSITLAPSDLAWEPFRDGDFQVDLPAWERSKLPDDEAIFAISESAATFWIKRWPFIPRMVAENVGIWAEENAKASLIDQSLGSESSRLDISIKDGFRTMHLRSLIFYCNAVTYEVSAATLESQFEAYAAVFDQALDSAVCHRPEPQTLPHGNPDLGMVILPRSNAEGTFNLGDYQQALALARKSGVQVSHYYVQWGEIETEPGVYDWTVPDYILEATSLEGLQISIVVNLIHTTVMGRVPPDLVGAPFDDPQFSERLVQFLMAFADRYEGRLHYLSVGNEVNDYFVSHREEVQAYAALFDKARAAVQADHPDLPMGIVFAYHDAERLGTLDVVHELNRGDFIAYTLYLYNDGFHFTFEPSLIGEYLDRMIDLADGTPIAVVEIGWSTAETLQGTEADQAEYVRQVFSALEARREHFHFLTWFALHDSLQEHCAEQALTFFEPGQAPSGPEMEAFVTFICHFGLINTDGTPKPAWEVWVESAEDYNH
jgi:hypothetical protein